MAELDSEIRRDDLGNYALVEGTTDEHVMVQLLFHYGLWERFGDKHIINKSGLSQLLDSLPVVLKSSGIGRVAIVVDADTDLRARWSAVANRLRNLGYRPIPRTPNPLGFIISAPDLPKVGVWLMPDNTRTGMIEDFASTLVPADDELWSIADAAVSDAYTHGCLVPPVHRIKAHIHTWLAWQPEPGRPIGLAIKFKYLDANANLGVRFIDWIRRLLT